MDILYFLLSMIFGSGLTIVVAKKAFAQIIDERIKKRTDVIWDKFDKFKQEVKDNYISKETFNLYNEFIGKDIKQVNDSIKELSSDFKRYIMSGGGNQCK